MIKKVSILLMLILFPISISSNDSLSKAYLYFLSQQYKEAIIYYNQAQQEFPDSIEPAYGLYNCYLYLGDYNNAALIMEKARNKHGENFFINNKLVYVYALLNNKIKAETIYSETIKFLNSKNAIDLEKRKYYGQEYAPDILHQEMLNSIGYGFYYAGNYSESVKWFKKAVKKFPQNVYFPYSLSYARVARASSLKSYADVYSGILSYSENDLFKNGTYSGISIGTILNKTHSLNASYNYTILKKTDAASINSDSELSQDEIVLKYENFRKLIKDTSLLFGGRFTDSNMLGSEKENTLFIRHRSGIKSYVPEVLYSFSNFNYFSLWQISPNVTYYRSNYSIFINGNFISKISEDKDNSYNNEVKDTQFSEGLGFTYNWKKVSLSTEADFGDRKFLIESDGDVNHNSFKTLQHKIKGTLSTKPFEDIPVTFYYVISYSKYDDYTLTLNMGGITLQW